MEPTLAQLNHRGYIVIKELLTLETILGSPSGSTNQGNKANRTTSNQTGHTDPPATRTKTGHPD
jgi:hypothetical protein